MKQVVIGIDIGGTFTKYGFVDRSGNIYGEGTISTSTYQRVDEFLKELNKSIQANLEKHSDIEIKGVGIGAPNGNYYNGTIEFAPNLNWKGIVPLADLIHKIFNVPAVLTNDANAAALGEMIYGGAKGMKNFIEITLGTGLGSGLVVNGEVVYGHDGFAGELGHFIVKRNGRQCACGRRGCLETYASATGIKRTVFKLMADSLEDSKFRSISYDKLTAEMISHAATEGDKIALMAFEYTGSMLGYVLAESVAHISPEAIFLFGGLAKAGNFILNPTRQYMEESLMQIYKNKVKVLLSGLSDVNAAVMGSAALAWKEIEKK
jgi:glucokinase